MKIQANLDGTYNLLEDYSFGGVIVPTGFRTDFASIPRIFWVLASPLDDGIMRPALVHDYLYSIGHDRGESDLHFYYYMVCLGYRWAFVAYLSVRLFGWTVFNYQERKPLPRKILDFIC